MNSQDLTNLDVVLYALYSLGGTRKKIFTEDIAKKSFELAPERFSWRRYPQYPDVDPTRKRLYEARDIKKLIKGRAGEVTGMKSSDGWIFSPLGIKWIEKNKSRIALAVKVKPKQINRTDLAAKLNELESSVAFKKFKKNKNCKTIKPYEFTDFLNASLDTPHFILKTRVDKINALAADSKKPVLLDFIKECKKHFSKLLKTSL